MAHRAIRSALLTLVGLLWLGGTAAAQMADDERRFALALEFQKLRSAAHPASANLAEQEIWRLWFTGPNETVTEGLAIASQNMREGDHALAEERLTALILKAPNHAELWNQRAFARFLQYKFEGSLKDIERVLALEPRHFGALAGRARIEAELGRTDEAQKTMGEVGEIHPWMARNSAIPADPPPPAPVKQQDL